MSINSYSDNKKTIGIALLVLSLLISIVEIFLPFITQSNYTLYIYKDLVSFSFYIVSLLFIVIALVLFRRSSFQGDFARIRSLIIASIVIFLLFFFLADNFAVQQAKNISFDFGIGFYLFFLANVMLFITLLLAKD